MNKKDKTLIVKVSEDEKQQYENAAEREGLKLSSWVRWVLKKASE